MDTWLPIVFQIVAGAIGGNLVGPALGKRSPGTTLNTLAGAIGGLGGGQLLGVLGVAGGFGGLDLGSILSDVLGGAAGGAILTGIVGAFRGGAPKAA